MPHKSLDQVTPKEPRARKNLLWNIYGFLDVKLTLINQLNKDKTRAKIHKCVFLGYNSKSKGYKLIVPKIGK